MRGCSCRGTAGFAHVSCLAEQAKILVAEAEENNLGANAMISRWRRWYTCSLCEQEYHGVVRCALGWACWKTYVGRPEADFPRRGAMSALGNGLSAADHHEDALSVKETELSTMRRLGVTEDAILGVQGNLASTYSKLGRYEEALRLRRVVYSGTLRLSGEESDETLREAGNYANLLNQVKRFEEVKALLRKTLPVARRVFSESNELTLKMRWNYAGALYADPVSTLNDLREAVATFEDIERTVRRVFGGAHPLVEAIELHLRKSRAALAARDPQPLGA